MTLLRLLRGFLAIQGISERKQDAYLHPPNLKIICRRRGFSIVAPSIPVVGGVVPIVLLVAAVVNHSNPGDDDADCHNDLVEHSEGDEDDYTPERPHEHAVRKSRDRLHHHVDHFEAFDNYSLIV